LLLVGFWYLTPVNSFAQEICNNGIDDDGDGFIDCYDADCASSLDCEDFFVGKDPVCQSIPTQFPVFTIKEDWASPNRSATNNSLPAVGDIDGDGIPEILSTNNADKKVFVLSGIDGSILYEANIGYKPNKEISYADIDGDGCAEIFVTFPVITGGGNDPQYYGVMALTCDLTHIWTLDSLGQTGNLGIADFNEDGISEVYVKDQIIDARTGKLMHATTYSVTPNDANFIERHLPAGGVAVDILDDTECANCAGLELVSGGKIFSININTTDTTAVLNLEKSIDYRPYYINDWKQNRSGTSIADMNEDGFIDIVAIGTTSSDNTTMRVFFWDVRNNTVQMYNDPGYNWIRGAGRPNLGDLDGDGKMNIAYVTGKYLYCLKEDMTVLWRKQIQEQTSGTTGTTIYDFNGDGKDEVVYRDEQFLYIINGVDGSVFWSTKCLSWTYMEYPIVADVDGDGATEICVSCKTVNSVSSKISTATPPAGRCLSIKFASLGVTLCHYCFKYFFCSLLHLVLP